MKRPAATPAQALKALRLKRSSIDGDQLARKLKVSPEQADLLVKIGTMVELVEGLQLTSTQAGVMKVIVRVMARNVLLGLNYVKPRDVDFAAGKRSGWCAKQIVALTYLGIIAMPDPHQIRLTRAGWAYAWETGLIKPNWTVPT